MGLKEPCSPNIAQAPLRLSIPATGIASCSGRNPHGTRRIFPTNRRDGYVSPYLPRACRRRWLADKAGVNYLANQIQCRFPTRRLGA